MQQPLTGRHLIEILHIGAFHPPPECLEVVWRKVRSLKPKAGQLASQLAGRAGERLFIRHPLRRQLLCRGRCCPDAPRALSRASGFQCLLFTTLENAGPPDKPRQFVSSGLRGRFGSEEAASILYERLLLW